MTDNDVYRTDHLMLLVGTNPLPLYVSANLLSKLNTIIHLVVTREIQEREIDRRLVAQLGLKDDKVRRVLVKPSDPHDIQEKVSAEISSCSGTWGLNYTGGTKIMAVHAHAAAKNALQTKNIAGVFSYLDASSLEMVIEKDTRSIRLPAHRLVQVSLEQMLALHGLQPDGELRSDPFQPEFCQALLNHLMDEHALKQWLDFLKLKRENNPDPRFPSDIPQIGGRLLSQAATGWAEAIGSLPEYQRGVERKYWSDAKEFLRRWLGGAWLEDYVFTQLQPHLDNGLLDQAVLNLHIKGLKEFEIDIAAVQGYRLFVFSITTVPGDPTRRDELVKLKMFEALERAVQMGGEEARVGLVTTIKDKSYLEEQLASQLSLESDPNRVSKATQKRNLRVFGWKDLQNLNEHLQQWFEEV